MTNTSKKGTLLNKLFYVYINKCLYGIVKRIHKKKLLYLKNRIQTLNKVKDISFLYKNYLFIFIQQCVKIFINILLILFYLNINSYANH